MQIRLARLGRCRTGHDLKVGGEVDQYALELLVALTIACQQRGQGDQMIFHLSQFLLCGQAIGVQNVFCIVAIFTPGVHALPGI